MYDKCIINVNIGLFIIISLSTTLASTPALLLTPLMSRHSPEELRNLSAVNSSLFLNVTSHSGFLTVDERYGSNTFFWYFPVANKPLNKTPWIVWLQGGPGASSLAGLFDEMGPFEYDNEHNNITLRKWSWTKDHSMLFIDNPVGAGYSYTNSPAGYVRDMDMCASHLYNALRQFLVIFPELRKAPLYIAGESFAGRYLPAFGLKILEQDQKLGPLDVDLQGIIMGNPVINRDSIADYSAVFEHWGLIDSQGVLAVRPIQDAYTQAIRNHDAQASYDLRNQLLNKLTDLTLQPQMYNILKDDLDKQLKGFIKFMERPEISEAVHVGNIQFTFSSYNVHDKLITDFLSDVGSNVTKLLETHRVLIYCGQLDLTASCVQNAQARRRNWRWSTRDNFLKAPRKPWWYNNTIAGYVKSGGRLTEVLVRGAGHLVAMDKPAELQNLVSYFIRGLDILLPTNYIPSPSDTPDYQSNVSSDGVSLISEESSGTKTAMIVSIIINVVLVVGIATGLVYRLRKRSTMALFTYNTVDETSMTDGVLAMS